MEPNHLELISPLPPAECASRLAAAIDNERSAFISFAGMFGSKPVVGRVTESSLRLRKRISYRNSFQSFFTGTMQPEGNGTIISGEFSMHPFVRVFMAIWFSGVILLGGAMFIVTIGSMLFGPTRHQENVWMGAVIPPVMLIFGFGLIRFGRYIARNESHFITDLLIRTLNARERIRNA